MVAFQHTPADMQRLDYLILRDGSVVMYFGLTDLQAAYDWFHEQSYHIYSFNCGKWKTSTDFYTDFYETTSKARNIFDCGYNLDVLRDCLSGFDVPPESGVVFVLKHFDSFALPDLSYAHTVLDIFAEISRLNLLFGQRLIVLLHSDNPTLTFQPIGASYVLSARWKP
ncbi:MAG TPA: barstar family protein [Ktedonobacteraceae bacterium]|nr:barstar family protein [Ktedonobacteraceae bacterium]